MNGNTIDIKLIGQDLASAVINGVKANINNLADSVKGNLTQGIEQFKNAIKTLGVVATGAIAAGGAYIAKSAIDQASAFEKYEATLKTMLGSSDLAKKRLQEYSEIGKKTPFELKDVVELGNQLQALGKYSEKNVILLGDLAAASGKPIEQVSGAYAKLVSGQKGVAVDMFRDLLITTEDWVKATGKGVDKSGSLIASTDEMLAALPKIMNAKRFNGMMDNLSQTFEGKMSNLIDSINMKFRELGNKILPIIKPWIDKLIDLVSSIDIEKLLNDLVNAFVNAKNAAQPFIDQAVPKIQEFFQYLMDNKEETIAALTAVGVVIGTILVGSLIAAAAPIATFIAFIGLIAVAAFFVAKAWNENWGGMQDKIMGFWNFIQPYLQQLWSWIQEQIPVAMKGLMDIWNAVLGFLQPIIQQFVDTFNENWGSIKDSVMQFWQAIVDLYNSVKPILEFLGKIIGVIFIAAATIVVGAINGIIGAFSGLMQFLKGAINVIGGIMDVIVGIFTGNGDKIGQGLGKIGNGIVDMLKGLVNTVIGLVNGLIDGINSVAIEQMNKIPGVSIGKIGHIPKLATGTNRVPKDMLAIIHKDEAVIPARYNPDNPNASMPQNGNTELNITVNNYDNKIDANELAGQVLFQLKMI